MKSFFKNTALVLTVLGLMASGSAVAEKGDGGRDWKQGPPSVEDVLARMSETLDLSNQQAIDLLVVLQQHAAERNALHEQTMVIMGPEICAQQEAAEDDVLAILTSEQAEQFMLLKEERRTKAAERAHRKGKNRPDCSQFESDG
ncbi:hypothetical protein ACFL07_05985 [Pseudomonadota bacterium]